MRITKLKLVDVRAFEQAEFEFESSMNLLVGVNGVGKTTALDAIRMCLSKILPHVSCSRSRPIPFVDGDISVEARAMTARLSFALGNNKYEFLVHKQREPNVDFKPDSVREQTIDTPDKETYTPELKRLAESSKSAKSQPLAIFFSTRRSLVSDSVPSSTKSVGGQAAAYADALGSRELRLAEFAHWMRAQQVLAAEDPRAEKHLAALRRSAKAFLPECRNLRVETSAKPRLVVDKGRLSLDVRQLSDGERGSLSLVLDIARRLSQANPELADPVRQGEAIILIDELDLHLHPKWQRTIVERLTRTFPRCQFIATTHSPQIVSAVKPEQVLLLSNNEVVRPDRTLGMDSNWILRILMDAADRPAPAAKAIREVEEMINRRAFKKARAGISKAKECGLDLPDWSVLEARMARMELLAQ